MIPTAPRRPTRAERRFRARRQQTRVGDRFAVLGSTTEPRSLGLTTPADEKDAAMSQTRICLPVLIRLLVSSTILLPGCDDDADTEPLHDRLRASEAENQRLREENDRLANQHPPGDHDVAEPSSADAVTSGGAVAYTLAMLLQEYDLHPEKDVVSWLAESFEWAELPEHLAKMGNATSAFTGPVLGHRLILGKGDIHGVFTIGAGEGFQRDDFLEAARDYCDIAIVQSSMEFGTLSELAEISAGGRQIGILIINSSTSQHTAGTGSVSFIPRSAAERLLGEDQSLRPLPESAP